jgi:hypothetical protein
MSNYGSNGNTTETLSRFAKNSGVELMGLQETFSEHKPSDEKMIIELESNSQGTYDPQNEDLVRPDFLKTKKPFHQQPKVRMISAGVVAILGVGGFIAVTNANLSFKGATKIPDDFAPDVPTTDLSTLPEAGVTTPTQSPSPTATPNSKRTDKRSPKSPPTSVKLPATLPSRQPPATDYNDSTPRLPLRRPINTASQSISSRLPRSPYVRSTPSSAQKSGSGKNSVNEKSPQERLLAAMAASSYANSGQQAQADPQNQGTQTGDAKEVAYLSAEQAILDGIPQQPLNRSATATGRLLSAIAFTPDDPEFIDGQSVEIEIDGSNSPALTKGTRIVANIQLPKAQTQGSKTGSVLRLIPVAIVQCDQEYEVDSSNLVITGNNGKPLIAKRGGSAFLRGLKDIAMSVGNGVGGGLLGGSKLGALSGIAQNLFRGGNQDIQVLAIAQGTKMSVAVKKPFGIPDRTCGGTVSQRPGPENAEPVAQGQSEVSQQLAIADSEQETGLQVSP